MDNKSNNRPRARGGAKPVLKTTLDGTTLIRVTQVCADQIRRLAAKRTLNGRAATQQQVVEDAIDEAILSEDKLTHEITTQMLQRTGKLIARDVKAG